MKCPECASKARYDEISDVYFCMCGWDEELAALAEA